MAKLKSKNKKDTLILFPQKIDKETWVQSQLVFESNGIKALNEVGNFFLIEELKSLVSTFRTLRPDMSNEQIINFIEPNFRFEIKLLSKEEIIVKSVFLKRIVYREGEVLENENDKRELQIITTQNGLTEFANELDHELRTL